MLMGWDDEYLGYTNVDNPFGDEHLLSTFVWNKKLQKEGLGGLDRHDLEKMQKQKMIENKVSKQCKVASIYMYLSVQFIIPLLFCRWSWRK